ncbi:unnamed protein product [Symbiodinium necroappetens]|uniref:Metallo-beta-lactamase domain-containing protein n=1 Tax=Symbiodinium necroappetens TaxID=1628268 RepID=A0A812PP74_9DINO|nr:unnamed protein product [Symbiodinium necroappetens]
MLGHDLTAYLDSCACLRGLLAWSRRPGSASSGPGIIFSGTGSSCAQPMLRCAIGGDGGVPGCQSCAVALRYGRGNPNWRNNVGLIVRWVQSDGRVKHVQIDCGKTYRESVLTVYKEHRVLSLDAVFLTHDHADAILGLDDLRQLQPFDPVTRRVLGPPMRCFCDRRTLLHCRRAFPYLFPKVDTGKALRLVQAFCQCNSDCDGDCQPDMPDQSISPNAPEKVTRFVASMEWKEIPEDTSPFYVDGFPFHALPVLHGADYTCFGYGFGSLGSRVVYISDYTALLPETEALLERWSSQPDKISILILDVLFPDATKSTVHANLEESLDLVRRFRPEKAFFVGVGHYCEHHAMNRQLRKLWKSEGLDVQLAHDGLFVPVDLSTSLSDAVSPARET